MLFALIIFVECTIRIQLEYCLLYSIAFLVFKNLFSQQHNKIVISHCQLLTLVKTKVEKFKKNIINTNQTGQSLL